jgi:DNA-binding NarL/FixJ family response regulator
VNGVRTVAGGGSLLAPAVTRALIGRFADRVRPAAGHRRDPLEALGPREREVLALIARGLSNAEIATEMVLGGETVKTYVSRIFTKLDLRDRVQAHSGLPDRAGRRRRIVLIGGPLAVRRNRARQATDFGQFEAGR